MSVPALMGASLVSASAAGSAEGRRTVGGSAACSAARSTFSGTTMPKTPRRTRSNLKQNAPTRRGGEGGEGGFGDPLCATRRRGGSTPTACTGTAVAEGMSMTTARGRPRAYHRLV